MMANRVIDAVQRFRKVEEATSSKDEPAPVYLLDELVEISNSSAENAQALVDLVVKKLGNKSPVVRFKALRVVKHMCTGGGIQFQRFMQKHSGAVRDCMTFKGEPDPYKGDVPNERVRELAKQVIELLFVTQTPAATSHGSQQYQTRIQGFGSGSSAQQYGSTSSSISVTSPTASKYQGFGNPRFENNSRQPPSSTSTYAAAAGQAVAAAMNTVSSMMKSTSMKPGALQDSTGGDSPRYIPGEPTAYRAPVVIDANQVLGSEQQLVDDICTPGGLRALPDAEDLQVFADAAGALNGLKIGELLAEKMESESWQVVLRALCALAAIVELGSSQACGECAVIFQSNPDPIRAALTLPQPSVQQQAAKVLKLILGEEVVIESARKAAKPAASKPSGGKGPAAAAIAAAPAVPAADLLVLDSPTKAAAGPSGHGDPLDLLGGLGAESVPQAAPAPAPAADNGDALFSGLDVSSPSAGPAKTSSGIDELSWDPTPSNSTAAAQPLDSLLGGLSIDGPSTQPNGVMNPSTQPTAVSNGSLLSSSPADLLGTTPPQSSFPAPGISPAAQNFVPSGPGMTPATMTGASMNTGMGPGVQGGMMPGMGMPGAMGMMGMGPGVGMGMPGMGQPGVMSMGPGGAMTAGQMQAQAGMGFMGGAQMMGGAPQGMMFMQGAPGMFVGSAGMQQQVGMGAPGMGYMQQMPGQGPGMVGPGPMSSLSSQGSLQSGLQQQPSWQGNNDVAHLMRHVASHGKHDPAFDFIKEEFKTRS